MVQDTTVDPGCGGGVYPLSPMQQGMLFHRLESGIGGVDVEQVVCECRHEISAPEFEQAWELVVRRHDCLRTTFGWRAGDEPRQWVLPPEMVRLPLRVLHFERDEDVTRLLESFLAADRRSGFARLEAPLARVTLFQTAENHAWFVFTYHHLVLDARGMHTLFQDVLDAHDALGRGASVTLKPVRPYREYITWLQTLDLHRAEAFWRAQLQDLRGATVLPLASPAGVAPADDIPGELGLRFGPEETRRLREAAGRHGVTLNTLLQGAWALVLSRCTGEDDVLFGAVRACRHVPVEGAGEMAGMLINTVPFRVRLASAASVGHWLRDLREQWVALRDYEHTPLMQVQRWSGVEAGQPLFETVFNLHDPSWIAELRSRGGRWTQRDFDVRCQPNYPLALDIFAADTVRVRAFFERRRFGVEAVTRLLAQFHAAALALAAPRTDTLGQVTLLDEQERRVLLELAAGAHTSLATEPCVHLAVARQAEQTPGRLAVADATTRLTYGELNAAANRLARRLRSLGAGPDRVVAVCLERSVAMLVAWLGALKAGGAFLPLDPACPAERLRFQLTDSGAVAVVTRRGMGLPGALPSALARVDLEADGALAEPAGESEANLPTVGTPHDLAYVIYTSGSTGEPKGVEIEHRALGNLVAWHQQTYAIGADDRATQLANPAFDAAVWEVWPYLTAGAALHILDDETRVDPARLWRWLAEQQITMTFLPTPLAEAVLAQPWPAELALRVLLTGGDQLKRPAPANLPCLLVNHYGPTECAVVATAAVVSATAGGIPPIGRPIANTTALVLDREMRLVPVGVPGELFLGGDSLARGYRGRPALTAERFVTWTMKDGPGAGTREVRLYRTGDIVRWRADGQLEFLGRADHQVKIRGCRIELGEIEAALLRLPQVREAVVLARNEAPGGPQLVGYVVAAAGQPPEEGQLLDALREVLPAYMVPSAMVVLPAWPLTPNGKVDRRALPAPAHRGDADAPLTEREQVIARIWATVLGRAECGRHDNFFNCGGHSLLAAQAVTHVNVALRASASVRLLFDFPTVAEFARELERQGQALPPRPPVLRARRRPAAAELELAPPR
ncbi:non-ribosomal peptide synthetase [Opitutus sp. ER46]|uniref:non-ribosomal peptide synthetase n=1 Tax=Opitutus sp. ER46 TaxID=2161864 RepID=UPI001304A4D4|nr:non-ribosomal peptide synthetase [Opitutus sp. ER46]